MGGEVATPLNVTADAEGDVEGTGMVGTVDYQSGVVKVRFGTKVTVTPTVEAQPWYIEEATFVEDGIKKMISRLDTEEEKELAVKSFDHWHEYNLVQKPEMGDLVRDLKAKGYGIYLCSNASVRMLTCYKEVLPAVECFDGILFSAEVLCMKPQKEMYGHFFERFGLKPEECYFIDDLPNNIAGAKACGMDGYCFADGDVEKLKRTLYESVLS
jgi:putative hydrolase of the HAD superfamily